MDYFPIQTPTKATLKSFFWPGKQLKRYIIVPLKSDTIHHCGWTSPWCPQKNVATISQKKRYSIPWNLWNHMKLPCFTSPSTGTWPWLLQLVISMRRDTFNGVVSVRITSYNLYFGPWLYNKLPQITLFVGGINIPKWFVYFCFTLW